jgi:hypothetical protein
VVADQEYQKLSFLFGETELMGQPFRDPGSDEAVVLLPPFSNVVEEKGQEKNVFSLDVPVSLGKGAGVV